LQVAIASAAAALVAFSNPVSSESSQADAGLRVGVAFPTTNPSIGLAAIASVLGSETLVGIGSNGRVVPRLALNWMRSSDKRDWTFTLPRRVELHDGTTASANAISELLNTAIKKPDGLRFHPRLADFYEISVQNPSAILMRSRTARILALEELADLALTPGSANSGIGAFVVDRLSSDRLRLRGFSQYVGGPPALTSIEFSSYRSQRSAWAAMMRRDIDAVYEVDREAIEFLERDTSLRVRSFLRPYVAALVFNSARMNLRDAAVRRALSAAVDRRAIVASAYVGRGRQADGPLWPNYWGLPEDARSARYDRRLATRLLERLPVDRTMRHMPARLRFRCLIPNVETQPIERIALILQKQLYEVGVDLQLEPVTVPSVLARLQAGDFDAVLMEFFGQTPTWLDFFWHSPSNERSTVMKHGYSAADAELDAMQLAKDENELRHALKAVYQKMYDDPPAIFIAWPEVARAVSTRFEVPVPEGEDIMGANLRLWRPAPERRNSP
jgi:peptide/nickel transport system substrate-binding protein